MQDQVSETQNREDGGAGRVDIDYHREVFVPVSLPATKYWSVRVCGLNDTSDHWLLRNIYKMG